MRSAAYVARLSIELEQFLHEGIGHAASDEACDDTHHGDGRDNRPVEKPSSRDGGHRQRSHHSADKRTAEHANESRDITVPGFLTELDNH
ncbi:hypothetical protein ASE35_07485 [Lysobacter sp. Root916]|nr:hypothetical protein ASD69_07555 [Lysobacter sp. Root604]KRD40129.1 hypothetical protein ASE35_07485 [Lysobacter sp. Root916]